ncbi:MAG: M48 family metalloprotease [Alphaproteobacteria bacterium]|nr:M48 family metalloprotease [Alphaproteobacteria bacterium]
MKKFLAILYALCALHFAFCKSEAHANMRMIQDTEIEVVIHELIEPLTRAADIPENRLQIRIISNDDFNAFVTGGEDIYIYTGLITRIEEPSAFQAVIAHELGHMIGGHIVQMSAKIRAELIRSLIIQSLGVGLMVAGGNPQMGMGIVAGAGGIANSSLMAFSRDEERIADSLGIDLMIKADLDPNGFATIMKQMQDMVGAAEARANPYNLRHPFTSERLKNVRDRLKECENCKARKADKTQIERYNLIRAKLIGYLSPMDRVRTIYPPKDKSNAAIYARAISAMRAGDVGAAKTGTLTLISRAPENPFFYELLGDIEYRSGHYDDSVKAYEKSIGLKSAPQIQTALALVLAERNKQGDADRAVEMAKRALLVQPTPLAYWVLSKAERLRGNSGIADWAMAEHYSMIKEKSKTREHAKRARSVLPKNSPEYIKAGELL